MGWEPKHDGIVGIINTHRSPGMHGISSRFERNFDHVDVLEECRRDFAALEDSGNMGPAERFAAEVKMKRLKEERDAGLLPIIDYQKEGHPLERDDYDGS